MDKIWFDNWESILRTLYLTILGYTAMVVLLRVSGKRTLSKMNAFDFIITIALGSALATVSLNKDVSLADGTTAFFLLIFLQFLLTWLSVRFKRIQSVITHTPTLVFYKGDFLVEILKKERITVDEVYMSARKRGISTLDEVDMIILEPTGELTIISHYTNGKIQTTTPVEMKKRNPSYTKIS